MPVTLLPAINLGSRHWLCSLAQSYYSIPGALDSMHCWSIVYRNLLSWVIAYICYHKFTINLIIWCCCTTAPTSHDHIFTPSFIALLAHCYPRSDNRRILGSMATNFRDHMLVQLWSTCRCTEFHQVLSSSHPPSPPLPFFLAPSLKSAPLALLGLWFPCCTLSLLFCCYKVHAIYNSTTKVLINQLWSSLLSLSLCNLVACFSLVFILFSLFSIVMRGLGMVLLWDAYWGGPGKYLMPNWGISGR